MKFAVCCLNGRVSPLIGSSKEIMVVSPRRAGEPMTGKIPIASLKPSGLVELLKGMKVRLVICGGIKKEWQQMLKSNNIQFIENVIGNVDDVVKSYLDGTLHANTVIN